MAEALPNWFLEAPVENLLKLFGTGGLLAAAVYWYSIWSGRRKIRLRFHRENYELKREPDCEVELEFEATNLGDKATSLEPSVSVSALTPEGTPLNATLQVQEEDRNLPPHTPRYSLQKQWLRPSTRSVGINVIVSCSPEAAAAYFDSAMPRVSQ